MSFSNPVNVQPKWDALQTAIIAEVNENQTGQSTVQAAILAELVNVVTEINANQTDIASALSAINAHTTS